jgi:hypothetical protein
MARSCSGAIDTVAQEARQHDIRMAVRECALSFISLMRFDLYYRLSAPLISGISDTFRRSNFWWETKPLEHATFGLQIEVCAVSFGCYANFELLLGRQVKCSLCRRNGSPGEARSKKVLSGRDINRDGLACCQPRYPLAVQEYIDPGRRASIAGVARHHKAGAPVG